MIKPYEYKDYELFFFKNFCKVQFSKKSPESLAIGLKKYLNFIEKNQGSRLPMITLNFDSYLINGFISEYFSEQVLYPILYGKLIDAIKLNMFQIHELVSQCSDDNVTAWYIFLCAELKLKARGVRFNEKVAQIVVKGLFSDYLINVVLKTLSLEDDEEVIKNDLNKLKVSEEKYINFDVLHPSPIKSNKILLSFISPKNREMAKKFNYIYEFEKRTSRKTIENKINKAIKIIRKTYPYLYNAEFKLSENPKDTDAVWPFLVKLIIEARFKDGKITIDSAEGLEYFLIQKLKKSEKINMGDFLELCKILNY